MYLCVLNVILILLSLPYSFSRYCYSIIYTIIAVLLLQSHNIALATSFHGEGKMSSHEDPKGSLKNTSFDKDKPDILNRHLSDIEYNLIKTKHSFVAVGKIKRIDSNNAMMPVEHHIEIEKVILPKRRLSKLDRSNNKEKKKKMLEKTTLEMVLEKNIYQDNEYQDLDGLSFRITRDEEIINDNLEKKKNNHENQEDNKVKKQNKPKVIETKNTIFKEVSFDDLENWDIDNFSHALETYSYTCKILENYPRRKHLVQSSALVFGDSEDWVKICHNLKLYSSLNKAKEFFEENFTPFKVFDKINNTSVGVFTGYHEISVMGNLEPSTKYKYPIYARPKNCKNSENCPTRKEINEGALDGLGLELCWISSPFDLWKLQLQGSGIVILPNKSFLRISFGGTNNYKSKNIWDYIYQNLPTKQFKHSDIQRLLSTNESLAMSIINYNPSYTFFTRNNNEFALGGHRSALVPGRSLAVDIQHIPYGVPLWVQTKLPIREKGNSSEWIKLNRILISQDTGSLIKGGIRGDIFFGHGDKATYLASHTKFKGSYFILIPNNVIPKVKPRK